jgi:hypothetical protein
VDICVEGDRTSPNSTETFPNPAVVRALRVKPIRVPVLPELIALKVKSGRARDDADVVELLKRHASRMASLCRAAGRKLASAQARRRLAELMHRAQEERGR